MVRCCACGAILDPDGTEKARPPSISGSVMGDEITETCYCVACRVYTIEVVRDRFLGEESVSYHGPVPKERGDRQVPLISACPDPWNKR